MTGWKVPSLKSYKDLLMPGLHGYLGDHADIIIEDDKCLRIMDGETEIFRLTRRNLRGQKWKREWSPRLVAYLEKKAHGHL